MILEQTSLVPETEVNLVECGNQCDNDSTVIVCLLRRRAKS